MILKVAEELPPELLAQTVNSVLVILTVGVPLMVPLSKVKPSGTSGLISHVSIKLRGVYVGIISVIVTFLVKL